MKEFALHILDIAENSQRAGATELFIGLELELKTGALRMEIADNGRGMDEEAVKSVTSPFFTSREVRKVGLGIPLLKQHAELTGGEVIISSVEGEGTRIVGIFNVKHPDMQPLGDLAGCWYMIASGNPEVNVIINCSTTFNKFELSSVEILQELGKDAFRGNENKKLLLSLISNNLKEIGFTWSSVEKEKKNS